MELKPGSRDHLRTLPVPTCNAHTPEGIRPIVTGPDMTDEEGAHIYDILTCPDCWDVGEDYLIKFIDHVGMDTAARIHITEMVALKIRDREMRN